MLSIDAGRPAPMTYNFQSQQQHPHISRGMVGNGFSSRGKAESIRKISIPSLPTISTSSYDDDSSAVSTPSFPSHRSSGRSQLLAGLRTAPKTPTTEPSDGFNSAINDFQAGGAWARQQSGANGFPFKSQRALGYNNIHTTPPSTSAPMNMPRSSSAEPSQESYNRHSMGKYVGLPTPPASSSYMGQSENDYETQVYADLLARNISLAQQQQILQQQMRIVQQAQQLQHVHHQIQQLQIQSPVSQSLGTPPISPAVYSPVASGIQSNFSFYGGQPSYQHANGHASLPVATSPEQSSPPGHVSRVTMSSSPPKVRPTSYSPPFRSSPSPSRDIIKTESPIPEKTPSPPSVMPSNFRRGHKKCSSLSSCINAAAANNMTDNGPKTSVPRFMNIPSTPVNSTFGGRGDHPIRQPRGPPAIEEILARPNAKYEGSKNFSSRQRRRALSKLVNAGIERRGAKPLASAGAMASVSENDIVVCFDDNDSATSSPRGDGDSTSLRITEDDSSVFKRTVARGSLAIPQSEAYASEKRRSALF